MIDSMYWKTIFINAKIDDMVSDASYPNFDFASRMDVVQRHVDIFNMVYCTGGKWESQ